MLVPEPHTQEPACDNERHRLDTVRMAFVDKRKLVKKKEKSRR